MQVTAIRNMIRVGNPDALTVAVKLPAVKRAGDATVLQCATDTEMGAHVRAVGVEHTDFIVVVSKRNQFASKVAECFNFSCLDVRCGAHRKPASRKGGKRVSISSVHTRVFIQKIAAKEKLVIFCAGIFNPIPVWSVE